MSADVERAANLLADTLGQCDDAAGHFTCGEADNLAEALCLLGKRDEAVRFLASHSWGDDDEDDLHPTAEWRDEMTRADVYLTEMGYEG